MEKQRKPEIMEETPFSMDITSFIQSFKPSVDKEVFDTSKFNFKKVYNKQYYKKNFEGLPEDWYNILEKCSGE